MKNIVVVDIDGTVANIGDRVKYLKQNPKDYDAFYASCFNDEPIREMCDLVRTLEESRRYNILFLTGRRDSVRKVTQDWLKEKVFYGWLNIDEDNLIMRPSDDFRKDAEVKIGQFLKAGYSVDDVAFVLEDRKVMADTWRALGVRVLQVAEGNY